MAIALIVLAIGSVAAGWIGVPHAIGGSNRLQAWLEPSFEARLGSRVVSETPAAGAGGLGFRREVEEVAGAGRRPEADETALERTLMLVSTVIAVLGIGVAWQIWIKRRDIADAFARRFQPLYRLLLHKYYVDEIYDAVIVQPIRVASQEGLWRGFDVKVIDGAVNGAGAIVDASATLLRRLQTGSVRTYAGSLFLGVVMILGYYLWR
jgi:NADH-quinone oxidoreductase subunit L